MSQNKVHVPRRLTAAATVALLTLQPSGCWLDDDDPVPPPVAQPKGCTDLNGMTVPATAIGVVNSISAPVPSRKLGVTSDHDASLESVVVFCTL